MDMQINTELLKTHRNKMAWSQTQLADVSGLSLRTIQRIEKTGLASLESVKAIASVLEVSIEQLQHMPAPSPSGFKLKVTAFMSFVSLAFLALLLLPATAQPIMVDLQLLQKDKQLAKAQLLSSDSSKSQMLLSETLKVVMTSARESDGIATISMQLYDVADGKETLVASPVVKVKDRQKAEVHFGEFKLSFTPHL